MLVLRTCDENMRSHGGFQWPESGHVECSDWRADYNCGNGLHGLPEGKGDGNLLNWDPSAKWLVVDVADCDIMHGQGDMIGKCKFPRGNVVHCGDMDSALNYMQSAGVVLDGAVGVKTTAGARGTATAGYGGTATAGYGGTATAGDRGTATAGYGGTATAGDGGTATAGYRGTATAGDRGTLIIKWWDGKRFRLALGYVGEDGIEAGKAYKVVDGMLIPA